MGKRNLFPGQDKHPGNSLWLEEVKKTSQVPGWKEKLITRVNGVLSSFGGRLRRIGYRINEIQIQHDVPIASFFSFLPLKIAWVQFNTWDPFTKKPGTRVLRFSDDTASLIGLVKSPKEDGGYDWYLLARKKYQFGVQDQFVEFSRGWVPGNLPNEMGWAILDRDYPGLRDIAAKMYHTQLGKEVWENTAEFTNKISHHLIIITLKTSMTKEELKEKVVVKRLEQEYKEVPGYPDPSHFNERDLVSEPMVFDLDEAAKLLNVHLVVKDEVRQPIYGENYSISCWTRFLSLYGGQFPHLMPKSGELPA